jgi:hypothetical protein
LAEQAARHQPPEMMLDHLGWFASFTELASEILSTGVYG